LYAYGFGVKEDIDLAISWCKKAAFSGVARAKWFLAVLIASRSGSTKEDWSMVKEYLIDAKNQGDVEARYTIALLAYSGKIEDYSKTLAISEFEELATAGHTSSKSILAGELLQEGSIEAEKRAIDLIIEAANDEDPAAIYLLSSFYLSGMYGFPKDKEKSDYYMNLITENKE
jgi:TPR repeat protein